MTRAGLAAWLPELPALPALLTLRALPATLPSGEPWSQLGRRRRSGCSSSPPPSPPPPSSQLPPTPPPPPPPPGHRIRIAFPPRAKPCRRVGRALPSPCDLARALSLTRHCPRSMPPLSTMVTSTPITQKTMATMKMPATSVRSRLPEVLAASGGHCEGGEFFWTHVLERLPPLAVGDRHAHGLRDHGAAHGQLAAVLPLRVLREQLVERSDRGGADALVDVAEDVAGVPDALEQRRHLGDAVLGDADREVLLDGLLNAAYRARGDAGDIEAGQEEEEGHPDARHAPTDAGAAAVRVRAANKYALADVQAPLLQRKDGREDDDGDDEAKPRARRVGCKDSADHLADGGCVVLHAHDQVHGLHDAHVEVAEPDGVGALAHTRVVGEHERVRPRLEDHVLGNLGDVERKAALERRRSHNLGVGAVPAVVAVLRAAVTFHRVVRAVRATKVLTVPHTQHAPSQHAVRNRGVLGKKAVGRWLTVHLVVLTQHHSWPHQLGRDGQDGPLGTTLSHEEPSIGTGSAHQDRDASC
eukprot:scaffold33330_cov66-Phaeocystis_antarctica.AAC.4